MQGGKLWPLASALITVASLFLGVLAFANAAFAQSAESADSKCIAPSESACYFDSSAPEVCSTQAKCQTPASTPTSAIQTSAAVLADSCPAPGKMMQNLTLTTCQGNDAQGVVVKGYCLAYNKCQATQEMVNGKWQQVGTAITSANGAPAGTQVVSSAASANSASVSPDQLNPTTAANSSANNTAANPASGNQVTGSSSVQPSNSVSAASANSGNVINSGSTAASANNGLVANGSTNGTILSSGNQTPTAGSASTFLGNSNLGTVARGGIGGSTSGSFSPVAGGSGSNTGTFSATKSTFGSGVSYSYGNYSSSLNTAFSSIGSIASNPSGIGSAILSFFTGLLSGVSSGSSAPTQTASYSQQQIVYVPVEPEPEVATPPLQSTQVTQISQPQQIVSVQYAELTFSNPIITPSQTIEVSQPSEESAYPELTNIINGQPQNTPALTLTAAEEPEIQNVLPLSIGSQTQGAPATVALGGISPTLAVFASSSPSLALDMVENLSGEWTYSPQHLEDEKSLAQAQSDYEGLIAQVQAMQAAESAGVCSQDCQSALAEDESEIPDAQQQVQQLTGVVNEPIPANFAESPSDIVAQLTGLAPQTTIANNSPSTGVLPNGSVQSESESPTLAELASEQVQSEPPIVIQVPLTPANFTPIAPSYAPNDNVSASSQTEASVLPLDPIEQFVSTIWNAVQSWFEPVATSTAERSQSCSLFASLFGGCKGW